MKKSIIILFMLCVCNQFFNAQNFKTPNLTKKQMQEDIAFLVRAIKEIEPHIKAKELETGMQITAKIDSLSQTAKNLTNFTDFYNLGKKILYLCQDMHSVFRTADEKDNFYISKKAKKVTNACNSLFFGMPYIPGAICINGNYYLTNDIKNMSDSVIFPAGAQILAINGIPVDKYMNSINLYFDNSVRWDVNKKQYYTNKIFWLDAIYKNIKDRNLTFKYNDSVKTTSVLGGMSFSGNYVENDTAKVDYFEDKNILYIRVPAMNYDKINFYKNEIHRYKNKKIDKVVIDVRDNGGGNDYVWESILEEIIDSQIIYSENFGYKNTPLVVDYLEKIRKVNIEKYFSPCEIYGENFLCRQYSDTITPSPSSIMYNGNIYVLANGSIYSSTLAFISVCNRVERLVTVGQPSGYFLGRSSTPFFLSLPNSKLIFWLVPVLDMSAVKTTQDHYDFYRDIFVDEDINQYVYKLYFGISLKGDIYSKDFLYNHDPIFQKVLEIK